MNKIVFCVASIWVSTLIVQGSEVHTLCGHDWFAYENEKCVRLFETFATRNQAAATCNQHGATLIRIKSAAEQTFLTQLVSNSSNSNNVWIGAERQPNSANEFKWDDGSDLDLYSSWAVGHPSTDVRRTCVRMKSELARVSDLQWTDSGCTTGDWFICEKLQNWSFEYLQRAVLDGRREMERNVQIFTEKTTHLNAEIERNSNSFTEQIAKLNDELDYLRNNPIPIGFVYVQLQGQPEPSRIWEKVEWSEITAQYAGLFFRAVGGGSNSFGSVQAENSPRLTTVGSGPTNTTTQGGFTLRPDGNWSEHVLTGSFGPTNRWAMQFIVSAGEVRPRNTAMRIWLRTK